MDNRDIHDDYHALLAESDDLRVRIAALEAERDRLIERKETYHAQWMRAATVIRQVEALDRGHTDVRCTFPDDACRCAVGLFALRAALTYREPPTPIPAGRASTTRAARATRSE